MKEPKIKAETARCEKCNKWIKEKILDVIKVFRILKEELCDCDLKKDSK